MPRIGGPWELLGEGTLGTTWSRTLDDGTRVTAKRLKGGAILPSLAQLGRLGPSSTKALVPIASVDPGPPQRWMFSELEPGVPLQRLLERERMAPMCAVVVAMCALDALAALHQVGLWHGAVHAGNIHVDRQGSVRLGDYCLTARGTLTEGQARAADIQAVAVLLCAMLRVRVSPHQRAASAPRTKTARTDLVELARQLAGGPPGKRQSTHAAVDARLAVWETAGRLATRRVQSRAKAQLSEMVAALALPQLKVEPAPLVADLQPPAERPRRAPARLGLSIAAAALTVATLAGSAGLVGVFSHPAHVAAATASAARPGAVQAGIAPEAAPVSPAAPAPVPIVPVIAPPAAGQVSGVVLRLLDSSCAAAGSVCPVHVEVWLHPTPQPQLVSWTFKSIQPCTGAVVELGRGSFTAQPGWTHVASESSLALPSAAFQALLAVSAQPDRAASAPLLLGSVPATC